LRTQDHFFLYAIPLGHRGGVWRRHGWLRRSWSTEILCPHLDPAAWPLIVHVDAMWRTSSNAIGFARTRVAVALRTIPSAVRQRKRLLALSDTAQQTRQVDDLFGNDMNDLAFLLQFSPAADHGGGEDKATLRLEDRRPEDQVRMPRFVFDGNEKNAPRAAGTLSYQYDTRHGQSSPIPNIP